MIRRALMALLCTAGLFLGLSMTNLFWTRQYEPDRLSEWRRHAEANGSLAGILNGYVHAAGGTYAFFGGEDVVCAYPNATSSSAGYTITGAATVHEAVDDGQPITECYNPNDADDATTYIECAAGTTTCTALLDLTDNASLDDVGEILSVQPFARAYADPCSPTKPQAELYLRINSTDYVACQDGLPQWSGTIVSCNSTWTSYVPCTSFARNPDNGNPWTRADIDGMQLYVSDLGSATTAHRITMLGVGVSVGAGPTGRPTELYEKR